MVRCFWIEGNHPLTRVVGQQRHVGAVGVVEATAAVGRHLHPGLGVVGVRLDATRLCGRDTSHYTYRHTALNYTICC